jgi:hypothetical protein
VTSSGSYTAKLQLEGQSYSFTHAFSLDGTTTQTVKRTGTTPLTVQFQLGLTNGTIIGTITDGQWTADLAATPSVYSLKNPAPQAGKHTLIIPGSTNSANQPGGNVFGSVIVSESGSVVFSGVLGDGTPVTSTSIISSEGQWPFYASLYSGHGSALGWLTLSNASVVSGQLDWFKLPLSTAKYYPAGFTFNTDVIGAAYTNAVPALDFTDGQILLANGNLAQSITNTAVIGSTSVTAGTNADKFIVNSLGLFKGAVMNPETGKPIAVAGAILQGQNVGAGLFLGASQSGSAVVSAAP